MTMYICMCNGVSESAVRRAAQAGIRTLDALTAATGCGAGCGCCLDAAEQLLFECQRAPLERAPHASAMGLAA